MPAPRTINTTGNTVTSQQADEIFRKLASLPYIPFEVSESACVYRSDLMIEAMIAQGVPVNAIGRISNWMTDLSNATYQANNALMEAGDQFPLTNAEHKLGMSAADDGIILLLYTPYTISIQWNDTSICYDPGKPDQFTVKHPSWDEDYYFHSCPYNPEAGWLIGHVAPALLIQDEGDEKPHWMVMDPALARHPVSSAEWKRLQAYDNSIIMESELGQLPEVNESLLNTEQKTLWHSIKAQTVDYIERYAQFFTVEDECIRHPRNWATGYDCARGPLDSDGNLLPDWNEIATIENETERDKLWDKRIAAASERLRGFLDYRDALLNPQALELARQQIAEQSSSTWAAKIENAASSARGLY